MTASWPGPRGDRDGDTERNDFDAGQANEMARAKAAEAQLAVAHRYATAERRIDDDGDFGEDPELEGGAPLAVLIGVVALLFATIIAVVWGCR